MNTREAYLSEVESQFSRLDREIYLLKLRVEEAPPEVMAQCYRYVGELRAEVGDIEDHLQALRETTEEAFIDLYLAIDSKLQALNGSFESIAPWIWRQLGSSVWIPA